MLGPIGLGYDRNNDRVLVQLEEMIATSTKTSEDRSSAATTAVTSACT